jgi:D-alanyl-D-alanine dipeptidase
MVYDCYRPQRAVDDFVAWSRDTRARRPIHRITPVVPRCELFARGYIAAARVTAAGAPST